MCTDLGHCPRGRYEQFFRNVAQTASLLYRRPPGLQTFEKFRGYDLFQIALVLGLLLTPPNKTRNNSTSFMSNRKMSKVTGKTESKACPKAVNAKSSKAELEAFFNSPEVHAQKQMICEIGQRLWKRAYVDGNGGNIAIRVGPEKDLALCTPTLISKGFMKPEDMCLVDLEGNQLAGAKKRTSEILMHLQMMKRQPKAVASVHCHPPHATAFAIAGIEPPKCMLPEYEIFCSVALAPYRTPGTPEMGKLVADLVDKYNTILMANHGVVAWSHLGVEDAYWRIEIIEAYCRTIVVAKQLGKPLQTFSPSQMQELLQIKENFGVVDPRIVEG